jgi:hypothetical protein
MSARYSRRDSSGSLDPFFQRRKRYEAILRGMGLWELFAAMPRVARDSFCQNKFPDPAVEFDSSFPIDRFGRELRKTIERQFKEAFISFDGVRVSVRDFYSVIAGLFFTVRDSRNLPGAPEACAQFMREVWPRLEGRFEAHASATWAPIHDAVIGPLVAHSRLDGQLLSATFRQEPTTHGKYAIRLLVKADEPQERKVTLDGAARPMYRVGTCNEWKGLQWLSWNDRPVFAQSHALRQLQTRINLPKMAAYLQCWMHDALRDTNIVERQGNDSLVEFRIHGHRLGYLVVTELPDCVAVRTFLFLTMQGTPESRDLQKHLRLSRRDVDWLGLSELSAFTQTDLKDDVVLRDLMERCGCGHLFELDELDGSAFAPEPKAFASEMRKYLRIAA